MADPSPSPQPNQGYLNHIQWQRGAVINAVHRCKHTG